MCIFSSVIRKSNSKSRKLLGKLGLMCMNHVVGDDSNCANGETAR